MKTKIVLLILLILNVYHLKSQFIQGVLLDSKSKVSIPYANVYFNKYNATVSDIKGNFILNFKRNNAEDTLFISCIGYNRKVILLKDLNQNTLNEIDLIPVVYNLSSIEIITKGISPYEILQDAFDKIKQNCENNKHFYKASYFEQINEYDPFRKWHSRTVSSAIIIDDPGYNKLHGNFFGLQENVYFVGINKNKEDSLIKVHVSEENYLIRALEYNLYRYKNDLFKSQKDFYYQIKTSYYDSILKTDIIEIAMIPRNSTEEITYGEVYLSSSEHKIYKIHIFFKEQINPFSKNKTDYYKYLNSDIVVTYKPNNENKMILSFIKYEFGDGYFYNDNDKPHIVSKKYLEYKCIGEIENGEEVVKKLPKMENSNNIYNQKIMKNRAFWLDYNIILKE